MQGMDVRAPLLRPLDLLEEGALTASYLDYKHVRL